MAKARPRFDAQSALDGLLGPGGAGELTRRDQLQLIPLDQLSPTPHQPRATFTEESLQDLADSIRHNGLLQPILVRVQPGGYEIVAGERRWRASKMAGLEAIAAYVRELDDQQASAASAVENLMRENLNPIEEVEAKRRIAALTLGVPDSEVMSRMRRLLDHPEEDPEGVAGLEHAFGRLGGEKWQSFLRNKGRVLNLPDDVVAAVRGGLDYRKGLVIGGVESSRERNRLLKLAAEGATVQQLRGHLHPTAPPHEQQRREVAQLLTRKAAWKTLDEGQQARVNDLVEELEILLRGVAGKKVRR